MTFKVPAGLSSILVTRPFDQAQNQIMDSHQDPPSSTDGHASGIFVKSHIAPVMQTRFDQPMLTPERRTFAGEAWCLARLVMPYSISELVL
jgi:hypothetical protein